MKRKSQLSAQFAWIFILIAGAIILFFFVSLIYKQKTISESKLSAEVLNRLETIFTGAEISAGTVNIIDMPETTLNFICDEDGYSEYSIKDTPYTKETHIPIIFAPNTLKGKKLIAWALEWNTPFKITNFLYLTDPFVKYVLINPTPEIELPDVITKQTNPTTIQTQGYHKIKIIIFDDTDPNSISLPEKTDVSAVKITGSNINFYKKQGTSLVSTGSVLYADMPSLYGAIFTQDQVSYECNMKKAFKRANTLSTIYANREKQLEASASAECVDFYWETIEPLASDTQDCQNLNLCVSNLIKDKKAIEDNQLALIRNSCPLLY